MSARSLVLAFDGADVRIVTDEQGDPWFVAADVARILGYREAHDLTRGLDADEKGPQIVRTLGGEQSMVTVTEAGLYSAIMRSRAEAAKAFRRWVTHEVLPAIRKTGSYGRPDVAQITRSDLARMVLEAEEQLAIAAPKAEAFDAFLATTGDYSVNEAAKVLSRHHDILTGERRLRGWMEANGWIYREAGKPRAYQRRLDQGVLDEKAQWHFHPETGEKVLDTPQVRVTARGIEALAKALLKVADQGELEVGA
jgi:anti-repressor protein